MVRAGEDRVELSERNIFDRILFVYKESNGVEKSEVPVRPAGYRHAKRSITEFLLELRYVIRPQFARHEHEIQSPLYQFLRTQAACIRWRSCDLHVRIVALESGGPQSHQPHQYVGASGFELAGDPDVLAGLVSRQCWIE